MKKILILSLILVSLFLFIFLFKSEIYRISGKADLTDAQKKELYNLALRAKNYGDLPISSLLLYNNKICGHAEINALRDAINKTGLSAFMKLDSNELKIISTLEPCEMCKGILLHYNIRDVQFIKDKSLFSNLNRNYNEFRYQLNKQQISSLGLLDSLSKLHPDY